MILPDICHVICILMLGSETPQQKYTRPSRHYFPHGATEYVRQVKPDGEWKGFPFHTWLVVDWISFIHAVASVEVRPQKKATFFPPRLHSGYILSTIARDLTGIFWCILGQQRSVWDCIRGKVEEVRVRKEKFTICRVTLGVVIWHFLPWQGFLRFEVNVLWLRLPRLQVTKHQFSTQPSPRLLQPSPKLGPTLVQHSQNPNHQIFDPPPCHHQQPRKRMKLMKKLRNGSAKLQLQSPRVKILVETRLPKNSASRFKDCDLDSTETHLRVSVRGLHLRKFAPD